MQSQSSRELTPEQFRVAMARLLVDVAKKKAAREAEKGRAA